MTSFKDYSNLLWNPFSDAAAGRCLRNTQKSYRDKAGEMQTKVTEEKQLLKPQWKTQQNSLFTRRNLFSVIFDLT